ncbi:MAG: hypothetical protein V1859_01510 [archaeon]
MHHSFSFFSKGCKKSQIDIIGLVLIVFILIIGGLFMLGTKLAGKNSAISGSLVDSDTSQSFLDTLMETKTMQNKEVKNVIKDCFESRRANLCKTASINDCCEYAQATLQNALGRTINEWNRKYRLTVRKEPTNPSNIELSNDRNCNINSEKEQPGFYYIADTPQPIEVVFYLCK